jgi:pterin-4a-carbinolamine dehydratase
MAETLDTQRLEYELRGLQGWVSQDGAIVREFSFPDRAAALDFMGKVSEVARGFSHDPEIGLVSSLAQVKVRLSAGEAGGVTFDDIQLAREIDALHGKV